jgi:hypothetical protein
VVGRQVLSDEPRGVPIYLSRFAQRQPFSGCRTFACLEGFDSAFGNCGGEDYEFGLRLLKADVSFVLAPEALAYHYEHETNNLDRKGARMF